MPGDPFNNEAVQIMASQLMSGNAKKYDKKIYWKRPVTNPDGTRNHAPGWIIVASSDAYRLLEQIGLGWTPLIKYGQVLKQFQEDAPPGSPDSYGQWGPILMHPDGPAEFPVEQIMTYRWYIPERCPVPIEKLGGGKTRGFPQLAGIEINEYECPDCTDVQYAKPVHLARHLTITHNWDRAAIMEYGDRLNISFEKETVTRGRMKRTFIYDPEFARQVEQTPEVIPDAPPVVVVNRIQVGGRRKPKGSAQWTPERRAEASRKAKERIAANAS